MEATYSTRAAWLGSDKGLQKVDKETLSGASNSALVFKKTKIILDISADISSTKKRTYEVTFENDILHVKHSSVWRRFFAFLGIGSDTPICLGRQLNRQRIIDTTVENHISGDWGLDRTHHQNVMSIATPLKYMQCNKPLFILDIDETILTHKPSDGNPSQPEYYLIEEQKIYQTIVDFKAAFPEGKLILMTNVYHEAVTQKFRRLRISETLFDDINTFDDFDSANKGERLQQWLIDNDDMEPDGIYFVDDHSPNCEMVSEASANAKIPCHTFHFIREAEVKYRNVAAYKGYSSVEHYCQENPKAWNEVCRAKFLLSQHQK